jgi:hypothetical protein
MRISGGDKLAAALRKIGEGLNASGGGATVRVGFLENAKYPDGKPVAMIAAIQDFGAPAAGIPPRPFFRNMIANKQGEWPAAIAGLLKASDYDVERALDIAGAAIAGQLKQSIIDTNSPPLAQSTIDRKGFSKPLIETSHMINSVDHEVERT